MERLRVVQLGQVFGMADARDSIATAALWLALNAGPEPTPEARVRVLLHELADELESAGPIEGRRLLRRVRAWTDEEQRRQITQGREAG